MSSPVSPPSNDAIGFEDAMKRLTEIVQSLEKGDLPLEDSLRLFEEGVGLSRISQSRLDAAQKKVEILLGMGEDGKRETAAFEETRGKNTT